MEILVGLIGFIIGIMVCKASVLFAKKTLEDARIRLIESNKILDRVLILKGLKR